VQETPVKETSVRATCEFATLFASIAMKASWYVPAGKQMVLRVTSEVEEEEFVPFELFAYEEAEVDGEYDPSIMNGCPMTDVWYRDKLRTLAAAGYIVVNVSSSSACSVNSGDIKTFPVRGSTSQLSNVIAAIIQYYIYESNSIQYHMNR